MSKQSELVVEYKDRGLVLNKKLLDQQNCWENLDTIKALHLERFKIEETLAVVPTEALKLRWTEVQFELQDAWKFPRNAAYHRFWDIPGCTCPHMDNNERWGTGTQIVAGNCPIHGLEVENETSDLD